MDDPSQKVQEDLEDGILPEPEKTMGFVYETEEGERRTMDIVEPVLSEDERDAPPFHGFPPQMRCAACEATAHMLTTAFLDEFDKVH